MAGLENTGNKYLTGKSKLEKLDFANAAFKGEDSIYNKDDLLPEYKKIKNKLSDVKEAYDDIKKAYEKLLSCSKNGKNMTTKNGIGKDINKIINKAKARKKTVNSKIEKIENKIDYLKESLIAAEAEATSKTGNAANNADGSSIE